MEVHSLRTMRPALLEGPHRPRLRRDPCPFIAAMVVLVLVGLAVVLLRRAHGSEGCPSGRCEEVLR